MSPILMYAFFVLIQGQGLVAEAFGTLEDCNETLIERLRASTTLATSPCQAIQLGVAPKASR